MRYVDEDFVGVEKRNRVESALKTLIAPYRTLGTPKTNSRGRKSTR